LKNFHVSPPFSPKRRDPTEASKDGVENKLSFFSERAAMMAKKNELSAHGCERRKGIVSLKIDLAEIIEEGPLHFMPMAQLCSTFSPR
jgi:hypothetical protein